MCDICSDGESDRDCMFDKSLWTASGPGKQREMRLQVKKELRDFKTDELLEFNDFWTLKGTIHQITCMTFIHVWKTKDHIGNFF